MVKLHSDTQVEVDGNVYMVKSQGKTLNQF